MLQIHKHDTHKNSIIQLSALAFYTLCCIKWQTYSKVYTHTSNMVKNLKEQGPINTENVRPTDFNEILHICFFWCKKWSLKFSGQPYDALDPTVGSKVLRNEKKNYFRWGMRGIDRKSLYSTPKNKNHSWFYNFL